MERTAPSLAPDVVDLPVRESYLIALGRYHFAFSRLILNLSWAAGRLDARRSSLETRFAMVHEYPDIFDKLLEDYPRENHPAWEVLASEFRRLTRTYMGVLKARPVPDPELEHDQILAGPGFDELGFERHGYVSEENLTDWANSFARCSAMLHDLVQPDAFQWSMEE